MSNDPINKLSQFAHGVRLMEQVDGLNSETIAKLKSEFKQLSADPFDKRAVVVGLVESEDPSLRNLGKALAPLVPGAPMFPGDVDLSLINKR